MNLSFAGCGFLGIYHVGVAVCFKKYAPHILLNKISGASAGSLAACCLLCDMPLGDLTSDFFRVVKEARSHSLGPFSPRFSIQMSVLEGLQKFLPANAHEIVSGRLHISMTRVYDGKNVIISQFNSREDLLQALLCACFIPVFSGVLPPRFHGVRYMDGGFSDNLPMLDENTVTVSPFCGESDICPRDNSPQMLHVNWANTSIELSKQNVTRLGRILFPPKPEAMSAFCQQGFDDALNFLHRNNLISCTRCLAVQSTFIVSEQRETEIEYDPDCSACKDCDDHRKQALDGNMPESVIQVFQSAIEQANQGVMNWIFKHRGAKLLTALALPAIVPADFMYASLTKILIAAPSISEQLKNFSDYFFNKTTPRMREDRKIMKGRQQHNHYHRRESPISQNDVDAFEHILAVTANHDHIYSYFYMDENNKVKVTEIFDCSESDDPAIQTVDERQLNSLLEYDMDINSDFFIGNSYTEGRLEDTLEISTSDDTLSHSSEPEVDQQHMNSLNHLPQNIMSENVRNILEANSSNYIMLDRSQSQMS